MRPCLEVYNVTAEGLLEAVLDKDNPHADNIRIVAPDFAELVRRAVAEGYRIKIPLQ